MIVITHEDIVRLGIKTADSYGWVKEVIENKGSALLKPKISMKLGENGFYNTMPAILPELNIAGVKVVNRYSGRVPTMDSHLLLYDLASGELMALMDANYITAMRTGAVAAYTVELLARKDFRTIGFMGLGNTAMAAFLYLRPLLEARRAKVILKKYKSQHEEFMNRCGAAENVSFDTAEEYEELIKRSDVVISAVTYTDEIFADDSFYNEGCLVVPIHTRGFQNCDLFFDKVYADDINHIRGFGNFDKFKSLAEISDIVTGRDSGRENDRQRILAYNIGIAIHDVYFAKKIYDAYVKANPYEEICLNQITDKNWVR